MFFASLKAALHKNIRGRLAEGCLQRLFSIWLWTLSFLRPLDQFSLVWEMPRQLEASGRRERGKERRRLSSKSIFLWLWLVKCFWSYVRILHHIHMRYFIVFFKLKITKVEERNVFGSMLEYSILSMIYLFATSKGDKGWMYANVIVSVLVYSIPSKWVSLLL